ncbi:ArsC family reductase [Hydrogenophaga sp. 5NK40-0174]|uniref:ArsC family reductase n=1 Tax=Hydrogenophaga sp. 5NK40-0174 TaxID=3127649 RepID=UPI003102541A
MITVYGIPNCDTVKKARTWLTRQGVDHQFHDFKKSDLTPEVLNGWIKALGWEALLNKRGTTWRKLDATEQASVTDAASAQALMLANLSLIKRPVVQWSDGITVGFSEAQWTDRV